MVTVVGVAAAGALGAIARWGASAWFGRRFPDFPLGTLIVNVTGSFALGFTFVLLSERITASPSIRLAITTGFLGAYTTFSTFSLETLRLLEDGAYGSALVNIVASLTLGLLAATIGVAIARAM
jgi:fluoride exporter